MRFNVEITTNGKGLWSGEVRGVKCTKIDVPYNDEDRFGKLRVYFTRRSWNVEKHGLVYTDPKFLRTLKDCLKCEGLNPSDVSYSEQGMQGDDYVSLDVGPKFLKSWKQAQAFLSLKRQVRK